MSPNFSLVIDSKSKDLGGFVIRRSLPVAQRRMVGPFIFFDHMGPAEIEIGNGMDVRPHPHIGLSTLTYLYEGEIVHRDTLGFEQNIRSGEVNWMTAGRGVAHSERSSQEARSMKQKIHGIQIWIALPKEFEEVAPSFHHHSYKDIPELSVDGSQVRIIAGSFEGLKSPVSVYSDLTYLDVRMKSSQKFEFHKPDHDLAIYCSDGVISLGDQKLVAGQLGILEKGHDVDIQALGESKVLVFGGQPFPEPRHIWWNFVSTSKERIEQAKLEWTQQQYGAVKGETEYLPLPSI